MVYGTAEDLRTHKILALRALLSAWLLTSLSFTYSYRLLRFDEYLFVTGLARWFYVNGYSVPAVLQSNVVAVALGWAISGWLVGRFHRPHGISMVLVCSVAAVTLGFGQVGWWALTARGESRSY